MTRIAIQRGRLVGGTISAPVGKPMEFFGEWQAEVVQRSPHGVRVTVYRHKCKLPHDKAAELLNKVCDLGSIDPTYWKRQAYAPYESDYFGTR